MFERYYFFFHYCLLSCRYVMFQKRILSNQNGGAQAVTALPGPHVATALVRSQTN